LISVCGGHYECALYCLTTQCIDSDTTLRDLKFTDESGYNSSEVCLDGTQKELIGETYGLVWECGPCLARSLITWIIFQPVEETSRVYFSKMLAGDPFSLRALNDEGFSPADKNMVLKESKVTLSNIFILYTHLSLLFLIFGPPCLPTLLSFILLSCYLYTSAPRVLIAYCWYLLVMAFNGVLEAFFSATASSSDLAAQSRVLVVFSALFIISSIVFSEVPLIVILFGSRETGLVYANASSLAMRAWYAWVFIKHYYERLREQHWQITIWRQSGGFKRVMPKAEVFFCSVDQIPVELQGICRNADPMEQDDNEWFSTWGGAIDCIMAIHITMLQPKIN